MNVKIHSDTCYMHINNIYITIYVEYYCILGISFIKMSYEASDGTN